MTTIVTRAGKGSPLTHVEVDTNFTNLNTNKLEAGAIALGSAATPSISFTGDTNTGIYSPGADQVAVATNGTGRLFIDSSGQVGIGNTTGLSGTLGVSGHISLSGNGTNSRFLALLNETNTYAGSYVLQAGGGSAGYGGAVTMYGHSHASYPGSVYIGTSSGSGGNIIFGTNTALDPAGEKLRITSAGLVGIGTTSPGQSLSVVGNILSGGAGANYVASSSSGVTTSYLITDASGSNLQVDGAWPIRFTVNSSERARIDSSGRLLVGTGSDSGGALFQVNGDRIRVGTAKTPATSGATGTTGEIAWDANYIYVCTATNTWKRSAIATW